MGAKRPIRLGLNVSHKCSKCLNLKRGRNVFPRGRNVFPRGRNVSIGGETSHIGGETSHIGGETSHIGGETSSVGARRFTGGRNVLNWDKSSRQRGRNVLKMGAKRLGGRNVHGAKCPGAAQPMLSLVRHWFSHYIKFYLTIYSDIKNILSKSYCMALMS